MKKNVLPLFAAFLVTAIIGMGMFVIGGNAATNKNSTPVLNSPTASSSATNAPNSAQQADPASVQQLQSLVQQYQQREQQYKSELSAAQQQINQDQATLQQFQQLMAILESRGLIAVDGQGRILIPSGRLNNGNSGGLFGDGD